MVSFLQHLRGAESSTIDGYQLIHNEHSEIIDLEERAPSFVSANFSLGSPRRSRGMNFDQMMTYINQISFSELNGWSSQSILQFNKYLQDRLQNSTAYRGYFTCFLQLIEVVVDYMHELNRNGQRLVRGQQRHDLVMALLCVQALNKAYGRRTDVRSSSYILTAKVAGDFSVVATMLQEAFKNIDSSIELPRMSFVVPRYHRRLLTTLLELCSTSQPDKNARILEILQENGLRVNEFTEGDIEWFESECMGAMQEHMFQLACMLEWLLYALRPNEFQEPTV